MIQGKSYFFFDLETVFNKKLFEKTASQKEKEKAYEEAFFPKVVYHVPVAVSVLFTTDTETTFGENKPFYFSSFCSDSPLEVMEHFFKCFYCAIKRTVENSLGIMVKNGKSSKVINYPILVTHNGKRFDLPVVRLWGIRFFENFSKTAQYAVNEFLSGDDTWENLRPNYNKHFSRFHVDTLEITNSTLESVSELWGIEAKSIMHGSKVEDFFVTGAFEKIASYCGEDVLSLARIFQKYLLAREGKRLSLPNSLDECKIDVKSSSGFLGENRLDNKIDFMEQGLT